MPKLQRFNVVAGEHFIPCITYCHIFYKVINIFFVCKVLTSVNLKVNKKYSISIKKWWSRNVT